MNTIEDLKAAAEKAEALVTGPDGMYVEDYQFADEDTKLKLRKASHAAHKAYRDALEKARDAHKEAVDRVAKRWVTEARKMARHEVGDGWSYLSPGMRTGLVCAKLVGILASQDEEHRNNVGDKMARACEMALETE